MRTGNLGGSSSGFTTTIAFLLVVLLLGGFDNSPTSSSSSIFVDASSIFLRYKNDMAVKTSAVAASSTKNSKNNNKKKLSLTSGSKNGDVVSSTSVLNELKETIRKQAAEIERLQKDMRSAQKQGNPPAIPKKRPLSSHHHHGSSGSSTDDDEELSQYIRRPFYAIAFQRVGWLSLFLVSLSLTALIMNGFEHTLSRQLELAYFVPLLAGHGGNTGGQTVGTVLSALGAGAIHLENAPAVIRKEALSGLLAGSLLGCLVGIVSHYVMGISWPVSLVVWCTIPLVSTIASTLGSTIPFVCLLLGLEPSVIAAPAMTSFVDVTGLLSYFLIANQIFRLFGIEL
jgi:cation transporter-like permease